MPAAGPPLDDHQYALSGLRAYEAVYGRDFVSPGGRAATAEILALVDWPPQPAVLDVGSGLGGAAFMMATRYDASVIGIDSSPNMVDQARRRRESHGLSDRVTLIHGDILTYDLSGSFDLIHSREVFLHVHDKRALFQRLHDLLRPGGRLLFTDYCCGSGEWSPAFAGYVEQFGYDLRTIVEIEGLLIETGFSDVTSLDHTAWFIEIHERELATMTAGDLPSAERRELEIGWQAKIDRARAGEQRWGLFQASRAMR